MQPIEISELDVLRRAVQTLSARIGESERRLAMAEAVNAALSEMVSKQREPANEKT